MSRKREHNRQQQRKGILIAARDLFTRHGFEDVTVAEVAEAAGVARATVFNHFRSKTGLVDAMREGTMGAYQTLLDKALADETTPTPTLMRAMFDLMGLGIEQDRRFYRGVFRELAKLQFGFDEGGASQRASDEALARLRKLVARGQERGELRRDIAANVLVLCFTVLLNGTITDWLYTEPSDSLRERMADAIEVFLGPVALGRQERPDPAAYPDLLPIDPIPRMRPEEPE